MAMARASNASPSMSSRPIALAWTLAPVPRLPPSELHPLLMGRRMADDVMGSSSGRSKAGRELPILGAPACTNRSISRSCSSSTLERGRRGTADCLAGASAFIVEVPLRYEASPAEEAGRTFSGRTKMPCIGWHEK
eukprot:scaffold171683_cov31-Tisochrysis_lutea.AAC.1